MRTFMRRAGVTVVVALVAAGAVACGDDDDDAEASDANGEAVVADDGTVEIEMVDYAFGGLPASVPAGTEFTVVNASDEEVHEVVAFRLPDDETRSADEIAELPEEELEALFAGPPAMVLLAAPGGPQVTALGDGTLTEPGRYVLFCAIPTGADPDEFMAAAEAAPGPPDVDGGPPHFVHGMYAEILVE